MAKNQDGWIASLGCVALIIYASFAMAWIGFLGWMIYLVVTWLINK